MRKLYINDHERNQQFSFTSNYIRTTKYTLVTFLPLCILYQYLRLANCYFLVLCILTLIPSISPWAPETQIAPTIFVLMISVVREAYEDIKRYRSDTRTNRQMITKIMEDGSTVYQKSSDIQIGDTLLITEGQEFPSDLILLDSSSKGDY